MVSRVAQVVRVGLGAVVAVAVSVSSLEAAWAESSDEGAAAPAEPGGFSVGDGIEGLIDPRDGSLSVVLPVGGVEVSWDSRRLGSDRLGLGGGWALPVTAIDTDGGVRVTPRSGRVHEVSAADASGLLGYDGAEVRFEAGEVTMPSADGSEPVTAAYTLHELGGARTLFSRDGDPLLRVEATGRQTRWEWDGSVAHRLRRMVDAHGVVTELDWRSVRDAVVVRPGANLPDAAGREWRIERGRAGVLAAVVDPLGGRYEVAYRDGLVSSLSVPSGATTEVEWQTSLDGQPRVSRVRTLAADGAELSARTWSSSADASGWPVAPNQGPVGGGHGYETVLHDGATSVRSVYDGSHRLRSRSVRVSTGSGERELQEQRLEYPGDGARPGTELPAGWSRPSAVTVTHRGVDGSSRSATERTVSDAAGRPVERTAADGTVTRIRYDDQVPAGARLPIGLPTLETVTTRDGLVRETEHTLNAERTAVVASVTRSGTPGALTVIERMEQTVRADGFVTEHRTFPAGNVQAEPVVVTRTERTDLTRGTSTVTETGPAPTGAHGPAGPITTATTSTVTSLLHGGVREETDVTGRTSRAEYDALGRTVSVADPAGREIVTAYETMQHHGRNATVVSVPGGLVATEIRDELGRVTGVADNVRDGVATPGFERVAETRTYPSPGVARVTDAWGAITETRSDVFGRAVRVESPSGLVHLTDYDDVAGTVTTAATPTGRMADAELISTKRIDEVERTSVMNTTRADGVVIPDATSRVDGFGRAVFADDGSAVTEVSYDSAGNPARTTTTPKAGGEPLTVERRFDAFGTSLEKFVIDSSGTRSGGSRSTDAFGRVVAEADQRGASAVVEASTVDGLPLRSVSSDGAVSTAEYDVDTRALVRATVESPIGATVSTGFEHDRETGRLTAVFDPADPAASRIEYVYDDLGNLLETRYPDGAVVGAAFDAHGRPESTTDVTGRVTRFAYDRAGRLVEAVQHDGGVDAPVLARAAYGYDPFDRVVRLGRGNGVVTAYTFTSASEVATETTTRDGEVLAKRAYEYDATGKVASRADEPGGEPAMTTTYEYDAHDRLIRSEVTGGGTVRSTEYQVGLGGDVEAMTDHGEHRSTREFAYSPVGELLSITTDGVAASQEYDPAGNLTRSAEGTVMAYDAANRLVARTAPDGSAMATAYWADGSRRELTETGPDRETMSTTFHWAAGAVVNETHRGGGASASVSYLLGADRHARTVTGDGADALRITRYADADRHGNVTELTDETGTPVTRYAYTDYGVTTEHELTGASARLDAMRHALRNPYRYAGQFTDRDGTQPLGQRVYDAATMRFTSEDPVSTEFTRYGYADLNPITSSDPTGEAASADAVHWAVTALIVGVTIAGALFDLATAGTAMAVVGIVVLGAADIAVTLADAANQQNQFMPESVAMTVGFVVAAASLLTAGMIRRRSPSPPAERSTGSRELSFPPPSAPGGAGTRSTVFGAVPNVDRDAWEKKMRADMHAAAERMRLVSAQRRLDDLVDEQTRLEARHDRHFAEGQRLIDLDQPRGDGFEPWVLSWRQLDADGALLARDVYRLSLNIRRVLEGWFLARHHLLEAGIPMEVTDMIRDRSMRLSNGELLMDFVPAAVSFLKHFGEQAVEMEQVFARKLPWNAQMFQWVLASKSRLMVLEGFTDLPGRY